MAFKQILLSGDVLSLSSMQSLLSGNVIMTNANQFYDGPGITIATGKWLVLALVTVGTPFNAAARITAKLWNGTIVFSSSEMTLPSMGTGTRGIVSITLVAIVSAAGTETFKISAASTTAGCGILAATIDNASGNNSSSILALRIG